MRHTTPLALALLAALTAATPVLAQESDTQRKSFAQRIASLRHGWGSEEPKEDSPRTAMAAKAKQQASPAAQPEEQKGFSLMSRLPRLNPGDLLPGDMFSGNESKSNTRRTTAQLREGKLTNHRYRAATGSARARLMRDMRSQSDSAPRVASVPSKNRKPQTTKPQTAKTKPKTHNSGSQSTVADKAPRPTGPRIQQRERVASNPVVLERSRTARAGSVLSTAAEGTPTHNTVQATRQQPGTRAKLTEDQLRRELLGPLAMSTERSTAPKAKPETTKNVAEAVAKSLEEEAPAEAEGDEIEAILRAATGQPVAQEVTSQPEPPVAAAKPEEPPMPTEAPPTPVVIEEPVAEQVEEQPATSFEQEVAKRKFEEDVEQAVTPRSAPEESSWSTTEPRLAPTNRIRNARADDESQILMSQRMPLIASRVAGPRQIVIGREALYRITLANRGEEAADQLITQINVPEWAEVVGSTATTGLVGPPTSEQGGTVVQWRMPELLPGATQTLDLRLIARQGKPIELGVHWKHAPIGSRAVVQVQEPKLQLAIDGPTEVLYGKSQKYRLTVSNPGTGTAESVALQITPPGASGRVASSQSVGTLDAGASRTIEFEFTAQHAGQLRLEAGATALGDLTASAERSIFCRKPELKVDWRGPNQKYAGASATYYFRVRNPGTATAEGVEMKLDLPAGFQYGKASGNGRTDTTGRQVVWRVGDLRPGDDYFMELQGQVHQAGANQLKLAASDRDGLATSSMVAVTEVITVADLKLQIGDPKGPLPVGREAVYEVRVKNRGSCAAEAVNIVGLFSEGIEPYKVEGAQANISDGRVAIRTVDRLTVGSELVVKIHARTLKPGTHIFRAEVLCRELDIKLAAEETTRFYNEEPVELGDAGGFDRR